MLKVSGLAFQVPTAAHRIRIPVGIPRVSFDSLAFSNDGSQGRSERVELELVDSRVSDWLNA
jgi:hypothetical protein